MDREANLNKNSANMKCQRVKVDESFVPSLDEAVEVQHLLAEHKPDHASVDGDAWKHLDIEDFSYGFEYGLKRNCGGLDCNNAQGQEELEFGVLDGLLDEVDEVDDIHAANDISGACKDFLLDVELAEKISDLDCAPHGRLHLGNTSSESQSPGFSGSSNDTHGLSESSTATILGSECKNSSVENKMVKCELNDSFGDKWDYHAQENVFTTSRDVENLDELDDAKPLESGISSDDNEKKPVQTSKMSTLLRQKRLRKPTKRYIEEFSVPKSKHAMERQKILAVDSKDKCLTIRSHNELHHGGALTLIKEESLSETITQETLDDDEKLSDLKSKCISGRQKISSPALKHKCLKIGSRNELHHLRGFKSVPREESFTGISTQASFESRPRRGRPKKRPVPESDDEHNASESEDDRAKRRKSKKSADRRKHQRMWTLSEVMKLIDGIAQYGTGRWTDIKKLLFSSYAYRTPVDLRDKWRNLLRASSVQKQKLKQNKEVEQKLKHAMRPLPKSVIHRIRELATVHPYPRFTPGGRYIRRKKN
ncbi:hypothetical protein P3X46_009681 [Hevea brasiliensis]|uniref:Myb-like domain-containing protein n=1 Tax=Hevea brasiliensis TaxID=3981 RepID=A0ABQ9MNP4_HEVBR|nr:uncharacterized protein LOC110650045 [Hevea brasiliensis]XP_021660536.2 uncharacterized protein LOC110650045 [Hevea brasiliensis]XP_021660543.2 uncharacterized protein LOC110650045 [Hevea brasiliensis]XP_021660552.2 uncharacterized protein LOC110650045 [Hevea brasiliensis]XP_021660558.2 uncharacterized protein LOC110650045 [Hevea brasiliensis]XP_058003478.1 uncharacterized protein LOC110650045 [Hevea brasiliensis]KAJ9181562.1 hypothetical protein P3X46_009681 [Hevea brasiliensis]KAJ918156